MPLNFADQLLRAVRDKKTPVCVGLDPLYERLPAVITEQAAFNDPDDSESALDAILEYSRRVLRIIAPIVPAVKINIAYFEQFFGEGIEAYLELLQEAAGLDLVVIGDCKRGDVGHSAELYAKAQLADPVFDNLDHLVAPDAITVQSYMGLDGIKPFVSVAREQGKGVFALLQTSNESASEVQGFTNGEGQTLSEHLGVLLNTWAADDGLIGECGLSCLGAVVAPQNVEKAKTLRALMPNCLFLVPGYGAQGITAADVAHCFKSDGTGAIVNASRSVIYAFDNVKYQEQFASDWEKCVEAACRDFASDVAKAVGLQ